MYSIDRTIAPGVVREILRGAYLYFALDDRAHSDSLIRPGEPISFVWGVFSFTMPFAPGEVPGWEAAQAIIRFDGNPIWPANASRSGRLEPATLPREFYRLSATNILAMEVPDPTGGEALHASLAIDIVPEPLDASIFAWGAVPSQVRWKQDAYSLDGAITNPSQFATVTFTPDLHEEALMETPPVTAPRDLGAPSGSATFAVAPGGSANIAWAPITQAWLPWFDRALLTEDGDQLAKLFQYTTMVSITDEYANAYPLVTSNPRTVFVAVSSDKRDSLAAAFGAQATALVLTAAAAIAAAAVVTAVLGAGLGVAAGAAEATAQIFATMALDPPEPDNEFTSVVTPPLPSLQPVAEAPELTPLITLLKDVEAVGDSQVALSQTHGKLLGALLSGDAKSATLQANQYGAIVADMSDAAIRLTENLEAAITVLAQFENHTLVSTVESWAKNGMSKDIIEILTQNGVDQDGLAAINGIVRQPDTAILVADPPSVLRALISSVGAITIAIREEAPQIIGLVSRLGSKTPLTLQDLRTLRRT